MSLILAEWGLEPDVKYLNWSSNYWDKTVHIVKCNYIEFLIHIIQKYYYYTQIYRVSTISHDLIIGCKFLETRHSVTHVTRYTIPPVQWWGWTGFNNTFLPHDLQIFHHHNKQCSTWLDHSQSEDHIQHQYSPHLYLVCRRWWQQVPYLFLGTNVATSTYRLTSIFCTKKIC